MQRLLQAAMTEIHSMPPAMSATRAPLENKGKIKHLQLVPHGCAKQLGATQTKSCSTFTLKYVHNTDRNNKAFCGH